MQNIALFVYIPNTGWLRCDILGHVDSDTLNALADAVMELRNSCPPKTEATFKTTAGVQFKVVVL